MGVREYASLGSVLPVNNVSDVISAPLPDVSSLVISLSVKSFTATSSRLIQREDEQLFNLVQTVFYKLQHDV
jgi:hypothetical protein